MPAAASSRAPGVWGADGAAERKTGVAHTVRAPPFLGLRASYARPPDGFANPPPRQRRAELSSAVADSIPIITAGKIC